MLASLLKTSGNQDLVLVLIVIWFKYSIEEREDSMMIVYGFA